MVRVIDIEISKKRLVGRIFYGLFWAGLTIFLFYYLPTHFEALLGPHVPQVYLPALNELAQSISHSALPDLGIILAVLAFVEAVINGTWVYGAILIVTGVFWLLFDIILFASGLLFANLLPSSSFLEAYQLSQSATAFLTWILVFIIIIFVVSSLTTIVRGAKILSRYRNRLGQRKSGL